MQGSRNNYTRPRKQIMPGCNYHITSNQEEINQEVIVTEVRPLSQEVIILGKSYTQPLHQEVIFHEIDIILRSNYTRN